MIDQTNPLSTEESGVSNRLRIEYHLSQTMSSELRSQINFVDKEAFQSLYPEDAELTWSHSDTVAVGWVGDQLAAITSLVMRTVRVREIPIPLAGIGGVAVLPKLQGRGYGAEIIRAVKEYCCRDLGVAFGLLVCSDELLTFYSRLGWQQVVYPLFFDQPDRKKHRWHENCMILQCTDKTWPDGDIDLCGLPW